MKCSNLIKPILFIITAMMLAMLTSCNDKQTSFTQEEIEKAVLDLENQALGYMSAGNASKYSENFATDASYFDGIIPQNFDGINAQTRLDGIEEIQEYFNSLEGAPPQGYELFDTRVQSFGNTAILTLHYGAKLDNAETVPTWKGTSVYNYNNDKWQVVHSHWSTIKSE